MQNFPILFGFKNVIAGRGFFAGVVSSGGRALLTAEDAGFWMAGVNPGGIAGGGKERSEAFQAFKESYLSVLYDVAAEAESFEDFRREIEAFFSATNAPTAAEWNEAVEQVRNRGVTSDLPRVENHPVPEITVVLLEAASPEYNALDGRFAEAA